MKHIGIISLIALAVAYTCQSYAGLYVQVGFKGNSSIPFATVTGETEDDTGRIWNTYRLITEDASLQAVFDNYTIIEFWQEFPAAALYTGAGAEQLYRVYGIRLLNGDANDFRNDILSLYSSSIDRVFVHEDPQPLTSGNPNDYYAAAGFCDDYGYGAARQYLDLINAKAGWEYTRGLGSVIIGITDIGFLNHTDLDSKVLNLTTTNAVVSSSSATYYHGTSVAGIAAAITDNAHGVAGVGNKVSLKYYYSNYNEMLLAAAEGCKVINCSWGSSSFYSSYAQDIIDTIYNRGVTIVAAAGNGAGNTSNAQTVYYYPASYNHVISVTGVGATYPLSAQVYETKFGTSISALTYVKDVYERVVGYPQGLSSSCGPGLKYQSFQRNDSVDICAPGYGIHVLCNWNGTEYTDLGPCDGTSFAAPMVAGAAALLYSLNPNFTPDDIEYYLKAGAADIYNLNYNSFYPNLQYQGLLGAGRLDVGASLALVVADDAACMPKINDIVWSVGSSPISNNDYANYTQIDFHVASSVIPSNAVLEWEFVSGNDVVTKTGNTATLDLTTDFSTMVGPYQRTDIFPLEVYVRQKNSTNNDCVSAFYKESGYTAQVAGGIASHTMPYPADICDNNLDGTVVIDRNSPLRGNFRGENIFFGSAFNDSSTVLTTTDRFINAAASKQVRILPGFHIDKSYYITTSGTDCGLPVFRQFYNYFHAYISSDCNVPNHYKKTYGGGGNENNVTIDYSKEEVKSRLTAIEESKKFKLYPNPVTDYVTLEAQSDKSCMVNIILTDTKGMTLFSSSKQLQKGVQKIEFPVGYLSNGVYILKVQSNKERSVFKFTKK